MKSPEILSALPRWKSAGSKKLLDSPAWAMPCRLGEEPSTLRIAEVRPSDTLDLSVLLDDERHVLSIADSPRFADLHALWPSRADVPEQIVLALVERECGILLQIVENAVRRQLKIEGLAAEGFDGPMLFAQAEDVVFGIARSHVVEAALGQLRFIDCSHPSVRAETLPAEVEYAAFALPAEDSSALAVGDVLLVPEIGALPPRIVAGGRFAVDGNGVSPFAEDGRCRVVSVDPRTVTLGEMFDAAEGIAPGDSAADAGPKPSLDCAPLQQLRLVQSGRTIASGRFDRLADQPAFVIESLTPNP